MKVKFKASGEIIEVSEVSAVVIKDSIPFVRYFADDDGNIYDEQQLEFLPDIPEKVIEGWVARDKGGGLYLHWEQPHRGTLEWHTPFGNPRKLPQYSFPEVTWESEPLKVKLTLTPME